MSDDPKDPKYRYPEPGERYWHWVRRQWVIVRPADGPAERAADDRGLRILGEVPVIIEDTGEHAIVKLARLDTECW